MSWVWDAMWARVGWAIGEVLVAIGWVLVLIVGFIVFSMIQGAITKRRQSRCSHERVARSQRGWHEMRCVSCDKVMSERN